MGHVVGEIYSEVGFGGHFSPFLATKQGPILACSSERILQQDLHIPVYDWIVPKLQSGELQIKQNLISKLNQLN